MNCIGPCAPAYDDAVFAPCPVSTCPIAASSVQDMPAAGPRRGDVQPLEVRRHDVAGAGGRDPGLTRRGDRGVQRRDPGRGRLGRRQPAGPLAELGQLGVRLGQGGDQLVVPALHVGRRGGAGLGRQLQSVGPGAQGRRLVGAASSATAAPDCTSRCTYATRRSASVASVAPNTLAISAVEPPAM